MQGYLRFLQAAHAAECARSEAEQRAAARELRLAIEESERLTVRSEETIAALDAVLAPIRTYFGDLIARVVEAGEQIQAMKGQRKAQAGRPRKATRRQGRGRAAVPAQPHEADAATPAPMDSADAGERTGP